MTFGCCPKCGSIEAQKILFFFFFFLELFGRSKMSKRQAAFDDSETTKAAALADRSRTMNIENNEMGEFEDAWEDDFEEESGDEGQDADNDDDMDNENGIKMEGSYKLAACFC